MKMDMLNVIVEAFSADPHKRLPAEKKLAEYEASNFVGFLESLCVILADTKQSEEIRQLAGLQLKNAFTAKEEQLLIHKKQRWLMIPEATRERFRRGLFAILSDEVSAARKTAALVVAYIGAIEIPKGQWPSLVSDLVKNIQSGSSALKEASFQALGYVCEECPSFLQDKSNDILNAISMGMNPQENNTAIKLAATIALANSMEFIKENMGRKKDRHLIMNMIFHSSQVDNQETRKAAFQSLVAIATLYYDVLDDHIIDLFKLTTTSIKQDVPEVAVQAIEFWSSICEVESLIEEETAELERHGKRAMRKSKEFGQKALSPLVPLLLQGMTKQSEDVGDETWNVAKAASACLALLAQVTKDEVVAHVLPFVKEHIRDASWRLREASVMAFGCMVEGPSEEKLQDLVNHAFPVIIALMQDNEEVVKDSAAWTIGRICQVVPGCITPKILESLMATFAQGLKEHPKIASQICWAIDNLASMVELDDDTETTPLSPYFEGLVSELLKTTQRDDVDEHNLLASSYEAVNTLIESAASDVFHLIAKLLPAMIERLGSTFKMQANTSAEREQINAIQGSLCGSLVTVIQKLEVSTIQPYADSIMQMLLQVLQAKNSTIHQEALMAIGRLAHRLEGDFEKYLGAFMPYLVLALRSFQEQQVLSIAVGTVSDVCRAVSTKVIPYADEVMKQFLNILQSADIDRTIKTNVISALGDVAFATNGYFDRYLPYFMPILGQASQSQLESEDLEDIEYLEALRESIFEAYTSIMQGLAADRKSSAFVPYLGTVYKFLDDVSKEEVLSERVVKSAVGVIGDLVDTLPEQVRPGIKAPCISALLEKGLSSKDETLYSTSQWVSSLAKKLAA